ncbi:hypothetical protein CFC21_101801 [Triticum aestivum]|uniref:Uncharacterized protein n=3 Tax=Triticum TaxID=4564 RepID=A0A9R0ZVT9_TRITD|nr:hypothetical protein CFC21_101801 [Triticum aestivum]VAI84281.1 unnamed protein product [Triticum turgidum subsp. durum]
MKRNTLVGGSESYISGNNTRIRILPPNTFNFRPKDHIQVYDMEICLLDIKDIIRRQEKGCMQSNINNPAVYFTPRPTYIMFDGIAMTLEEIQIRRDEIKYAANWAKIMKGCYFEYQELIERI